MKKYSIDIIDTNAYDFDEEKGVYSKMLKRYLKGDVGSKNTYPRFTLKCTDGKQHVFLCHRVIWEIFMGKVPNGYEINHKDENHKNFKLSNLEILKHIDNMNYGTRNKRVSEKMKGKLINNASLSKQVYQYTLNDKLVAIYPSVREAARKTELNWQNISACCRGIIKKYKGYRWSYTPL